MPAYIPERFRETRKKLIRLAYQLKLPLDFNLGTDFKKMEDYLFSTIKAYDQKLPSKPHRVDFFHVHQEPETFWDYIKYGIWNSPFAIKFLQPYGILAWLLIPKMKQVQDNRTEWIERDIRIRYVTEFADCVTIIEENEEYAVDMKEDSSRPPSRDPMPYEY